MSIPEITPGVNAWYELCSEGRMLLDGLGHIAEIVHQALPSSHPGSKHAETVHARADHASSLLGIFQLPASIIQWADSVHQVGHTCFTPTSSPLECLAAVLGCVFSDTAYLMGDICAGFTWLAQEWASTPPLFGSVCLYISSAAWLIGDVYEIGKIAIQWHAWYYSASYTSTHVYMLSFKTVVTLGLIAQGVLLLLILTGCCQLACPWILPAILVSIFACRLILYIAERSVPPYEKHWLCTSSSLKKTNRAGCSEVI